jgi:hypothetical protein
LPGSQEAPPPVEPKIAKEGAARKSRKDAEGGGILFSLPGNFGEIGIFVSNLSLGFMWFRLFLDYLAIKF